MNRPFQNILPSLFACFFLLGTRSTLVFGAELPAEHRINAVSVYPGKAILERVAELSLQEGRHTVLLDGIPAEAPVDSLRVSASGSSELLIFGAERRTRSITEPIQEKRGELEAALRRVGFEIAQLEREKERLEKERALIRGITLEQPPVEGDAGRSVDEMKNLLAFVGEGVRERDDRLGALDQELLHLREERQRIQQELQKLGPETRSVSSVAVEVEARKPFRGALSLTHETGDGKVRWTPAYRASVDLTGEKPQFALDTYAVIQQFTGEVWRDVKLTVSTSQPGKGLSRPNVSPHYLDILRPQLPAKEFSGSVGNAARSLSMDSVQEEARYERASSYAAKANALQEAKTVFAKLSDSGPLEFEVPSRTTIESEGNENRVPLSSNELKGELRYTAVPSQIESVYREIDVENSLQYALLPGPIDLFVEGTYFGKERAGLVKPSESFTLPLGEAQDMTVKWEQKRDYEEDSGLVRSYRSIQRDYLITVENLSGSTRKVVVLEPSPVSKNEKISVEVTKISPNPLPLKDKARLDDREGILEWHTTVQPKESTELSYSTTVEFKSDLTVTGLPQ